MDNKQNIVKKEDFIFGLDVGSSKINLFGGRIEGDSVRVIECGDYNLTKPDNIDEQIECLKEAATLLEDATSVDVHDIYVGIAGSHVLSFKSKGILTLPTGEVRDCDIEEIVKQASTIAEAAGEIIHVFPGDFTLDGQSGIKNPKGWSGKRLEVDVQIVSARSNVIKNLAKTVERAGMNVAGFVLEPLAAACAVLTDDERELGVAVIDIGAGSADVAVFLGTNSTVRYTASLDLAGDCITRDISKCLKVPIPLSKAEEVKRKYGTCKISNLIEDATFPVPAIGERPEMECSQKLLAQVINARVQEIFTLLANDMKKNHVDSLVNGGIVLTGGCCNLDGIDAIAEKVFNKPARIGHPKGMTGIQDAYQRPSYATGIGLLYFAAKQRRENKRHETGTQIAVTVKKFGQRLKDLIKIYF
ncbi:MAG: cell division protein FtsA [Fibrobacteraceae bacterium]|nr:cell division protein FtsA [Fibrobacteraceae bacterium]